MNEKQLRDVQPEPAEILKMTTMKSRKYLTIDSGKICERQGERRKFEGEKGKNERLIEVKLEIPEGFVGG